MAQPCSPPVACNDQSLNSSTVQRKIWREFLCRVLFALDATTNCTVASLLSNADAYLCQGSPAKLKLLQAQNICSGLDLDCAAFDCLTPLDEEAIISYLVCQIVLEIQIS